jgi:hypothetical protein
VRVFLLSPAHAGGRRAQMLLRPAAEFALAAQLRSVEGAPIGEVFSFVSGLYFRGKLAYARAFARAPQGRPGAFVITPNAGLWPVEETINAAGLRAFGGVDIARDDPRYRAPLERDARRLLATLGPRGEVVLLGSVASGKYVDVLTAIFGEQLRFPPAFVGRGDMSRGGLLLRCVEAGRELPYVPVAGALRRGPRPPKLPRK